MSKKVYRMPNEGYYHRTPECIHIEGKDNIREITRDDAGKLDLTPCSRCTDRERPRGRVEKDPCPFCGKQVYRLSVHLEDCQEAPRSTPEP